MTTFVSVKQLADRQPALTTNGIRHVIFNKEKNGLDKSGAICRIGKKLLIDEAKFIEWIQSGAAA